MALNVGTEVSTEYIDSYVDDSDYVSSTERYTPFPSLTMSKKIELERYINPEQMVSRFSQVELVKPDSIKDIQQEDEVKEESVTKESVKESENSGCCLIA